VAKKQIRESFKVFANIVTAQPQELPRKPRIEFGPDKAQERKYVRLPTLGANYMRAGGKTYTLPPRNTQGKLARSRAFKAPDKPTRKVSRRADFLDRTRHLARKKAELITPSAKSSTRTIQTPHLQQISRTPAETPIADRSTVMQSCFLSELDTDGKDDNNRFFGAEEDDLEVIINLKRDTQIPLLQEESGSEERPARGRNTAMSSTGNGKNKKSNFNDKTRRQPEVSALRPHADDLMRGREVLSAQEGPNKTLRRVYNTGCEEKNANSFEVGRRASLPEVVGGRASLPEGTARPINEDTPYTSMQKPLKDQARSSAPTKGTPKTPRRDECPVAAPSGKHADNQQPSEPSPDTSPDFWGDILGQIHGEDNRKEKKMLGVVDKLADQIK